MEDRLIGKYGRFEVSREILKELDFNLLEVIFDKIYILNITWDYHRGTYFAISSNFDDVELDIGEEWPLYNIEITKDNINNRYTRKIIKMQS